jgi:hypothetical protein
MGIIDPKAQTLRDEIVARADALMAGWPQVPEPAPVPRLTVKGGVVAEAAGKFVGEVIASTPFRAGDRVRLQTFSIAGEASSADMMPQDVVLHGEEGATKIVYEVPILQDELDEADERFGVRILEARNDQQDVDWPVIDVAEAFVTIVDDDVTPPPTGEIPRLLPLTSPVQPRLIEGRWITPVAIEKDGQWTLYVSCVDRYYGNQTPPRIEIRYLLNRQRKDKALIDPNVFVWDKTGHIKLYAAYPVGALPIGVHELGCRILGAPQALYRARTSDVLVGKAPAELGAYEIPVHGHSIGSQIYGRGIADRITWQGGRKRPRRPGRPRGVKLLPGVTASGGDPEKLYSLGNLWVETVNHLPSGLYGGEVDYRLSKDGWVITRPFTWQAGTHSAPFATIAERRKPEYNGERLRAMLDGYSTYRFGDQVVWAISLRGTLARIRLDTLEKEAVAGRVYREDTIALDHNDDSIAQAEIDAANYEYRGDAPSESDLDWDGPHDFFPDPRDRDNQGILIDSFHHRGYWIDARVTPARVTKVFDGGVFRRPYAATILNDGRIIIANTPKAGEEHLSSIVEISADFQSHKVLVGPDRCSRPFWLCQHKPGFVVYWEIDRGGIHRLNVDTGEIEVNWAKQWVEQKITQPDGTPATVRTLVPFHSPRPDGWGTVACDLGGTMGHRYDVFFVPSSSSGNISIMRFDPDGVRRPVDFLRTPVGRAVQGPAAYVFDLPCHYPWTLDFHWRFALGITQGFGNTGPILVRPRDASDPVISYDHNAYGLGERMFREGTLPNYPCDLRPAGCSLYSGEGHTFLDLPSLSEVLDGTDQDFMDYLRSGFGGSTERPEWAGQWETPLIYWGGFHKDTIPNGHKMPPLVKRPAPSLTSWGVTRDADGLMVAFTTDKPTFCCLTDGNGSVPSTGYGTSHALRLPDAGPAIDVLISDLDRNQVHTGMRIT